MARGMPGGTKGAAHNEAAGVTQVLVYFSIYQISILDPAC